ncbi:MAG: hypothetical protein SGPRY_012482 [Prymnesium sp.]
MRPHLGGPRHRCFPWQEAIAKRDEERAKLEQIVEHCKKELHEARCVEQQASGSLKLMQEGEARSQEREKLAAAAAAGAPT